MALEPTIYLNFDGNCHEAMSHYAAVLGGDVVGVFRNRDAPDAENRMPGGDDLVINMAVRIGSSMMMGSDAPKDWYSQPTGFAVSIAPGSIGEFEHVFEALSGQARAISMAPGETFWAERFTMFTDRYGTPWIINFYGKKNADPGDENAR
jgi:PhnB protein